MKATDLLRKQHGEVKDLLQQLRDAGVEDRPACLGALARTLRGHLAIEEELLYPVLEKQDELEDLISDSFREHDEARAALGDLERCAPGDDDFAALLDTLEESVVLHVDTEEAETLPRMDETWTRDHQNDLGRRLKTRFDELDRGEEAQV